MGYNDNRGDWGEHLVGELVIGREGRNDRKGYIAMLRLVSWASESEAGTEGEQCVPLR